MVSNRVTLLTRRMQCFLFFSFTFQPMFRDNNEKRDWTVLGNTTSHMYDHWQNFRPQNWPSTTLDKKKEPCCWCIKSESCDIEESECLIQLRNREWTRLATARTSCIDASWQNQTADSSISLGASTRWFFFFFFFLSRAVHVQTIFVQPSKFEHLSHFQSWGNINNSCCSLG